MPGWCAQTKNSGAPYTRCCVSTGAGCSLYPTLSQQNSTAVYSRRVRKITHGTSQGLHALCVPKGCRVAGVGSPAQHTTATKHDSMSMQGSCGALKDPGPRATGTSTTPGQADAFIYTAAGAAQQHSHTQGCFVHHTLCKPKGRTHSSTQNACSTTASKSYVSGSCYSCRVLPTQPSPLLPCASRQPQHTNHMWVKYPTQPP